MLKRTLFLSITLFVFAGIGSVDAYELTCPDAVPAETIRSVPAPTGWEASSQNNHIALDGAMLTVGEPKLLGELKPEPQVLRGKRRDVWTLAEADNREGVWFSCSYAARAVLLSRKIPVSVTVCWTASKSLPKELPRYSRLSPYSLFCE